MNDCQTIPELNVDNIRYIVIFLDFKSKPHDHDGKIYSSYIEAKEAVKDTLDGIYASKAIIGMFVLNPTAKEMLITMVETIGFSGDKKDINQLNLFKDYTH